jgi:hypothetical protein
VIRLLAVLGVLMGYTGAPKEYGPPDQLPDDFVGYPVESARDIDNPALARRFTNTFRFKTGRALQKIAAWCLPIAPIGQFNPEDFFPDDALGLAGGFAPQTAAQVSAVALYNPVWSNLLLIIEEFQAQRMQTAGPVTVFFPSYDPSTAGTWTVGTNHPRDLRLGLAGLGPLKILQSVALAFPPGSSFTGYGFSSGAGQSPAISKKEILITPGNGIEWYPATATALSGLINEGLFVNISYRLKLLDLGGSQHTPAGP